MNPDALCIVVTADRHAGPRFAEHLGLTTTDD